MKLRALYFILFISSLAYTQTFHKDSLTIDEKDAIRIEALPYYNFGKGVGITSPGSLFQMNMRFRMQNRLKLLNEKRTSYEAIIR